MGVQVLEKLDAVAVGEDSVGDLFACVEASSHSCGEVALEDDVIVEREPERELQESEGLLGRRDGESSVVCLDDVKVSHGDG